MSEKINTDLVTDKCNPQPVNPEQKDKLQGRKLTRRDFLKLSGATLAGLTGCTPIGRKVTETAETLVSQSVLFDTPETGIYNPEALGRWLELEQQPPIDLKFGIAIGPTKYVRGPDSINWQASVAASLGFQRVAIAISPPEFNGHTGIEGAGTTLDKLIAYPEFESVFKDPRLKAIHVTCDVGGSQANGWNFPKELFTPEELQKTYMEYFSFANYVLEKWGGLGKEITIGGPNEVELLLKGGWNPTTEDQNPREAALANAVRYYNFFHTAVRDANRAHPDKTPLRTGIEVLQIRAELDDPDAVSGLDLAAKLTYPPDEVTLSAWQFAARGKIEKAIPAMQEEVPNCEIAISEYGIRENSSGLSRKQIAKTFQTELTAAFNQGGKYAVIWALTDFNAPLVNPNNNQTDGLGLIRPDGSLQKEVLNAVREMSAIPPAN